MGYTDADLFADRTVSHNMFSFISLDFSTRTSFNNNPITSLFHILGLQPSGFDLSAIRVQGESNQNFKYHLRALKTNGDDNFCNHLKIDIFNRHFDRKFSGKLMDLDLNSSLSGNESEDWIFFLSLSDRDPSLKNKICEFNFDFKTYRGAPGESGGIFAQRLINNIVSSGSWQ